MSDKFNGFTQDEINKVSEKKLNKNDALKQAFRGPHVGIRRMPDKFSKTTVVPKKQQVSNKQPTIKTKDTVPTKTSEINDVNIVENDSDNDIDQSIKISKDNIFYPMLKSVNALNNKNDTNNSDNSIACTPNKLSMDNNITSTTNFNDNSLTETVPTKDAHNESSIVESAFKGISLKDFENHRKLIQEQNNQKKEILKKAIEQHSQKTAAEAKKIEEIKSELSKLDNDLAVDVAILRKQIDNACIQFANVERQYIKIEAQFLKAKLDLHNAAEKKELLTEHLCTVIAHNEDRKAQKLSELMEKVGLSPTGEYQPSSTTNDIVK